MVPGLCGGYGENFVGDAECRRHALGEPERFVQLLGQGKAHEGIPEVNGQLSQSHFQIGTAGSDHAYAGSLSGRGDIGNGDCHGGRNRQPCTHCHDAESKGNGEVSQCNGDSL